MGISPHLERAYELARRQHPHPNPRVGSVVVSASGKVLGEGAHIGPGERHAEVVALDEAGGARGATVYVSLEPCSHHGRTPPCVDRLITDGVSKVVVGTIDPDERVAGKGIDELRRAGIEVEVVDDPAARAVDPAYFHHHESGLALVTLKYAMTLDGSVAAADGTSQWITSDDARDDSHRLRARMDAVVVGANTLRTDDPLLDVRLPEHDGHQPVPVVIAGRSELPAGARLWDREPLVVSTIGRTIPSGHLLVVAGDDVPDPVATCRALAQRGLLDVMVEGGPTLAGAWWRAGVIQRGVAYVGAMIAGGVGMAPLQGAFPTFAEASEVAMTGVRQVGGDVRIDFQARR